MIDAAELNRLDAQQLRDVVASLMGRLTTQQAEISCRDDEIARRKREIAFKQATIDKLTRGMAAALVLSLSDGGWAASPRST